MKVLVFQLSLMLLLRISICNSILFKIRLIVDGEEEKESEEEELFACVIFIFK